MDSLKERIIKNQKGVIPKEVLLRNGMHVDPKLRAIAVRYILTKLNAEKRVYWINHIMSKHGCRVFTYRELHEMFGRDRKTIVKMVKTMVQEGIIS